MNLIVFVAFLAGVCAQEPQEPWRGPYADHIPGLLVRDTPEVAAAKLQHSTAHAKVLAVLPVLSPEERYGKSDNPVPQIPQSHQIQQPQTYHQQQYQPQNYNYNNNPQPINKNYNNYQPEQYNHHIPKHIGVDFQEYSQSTLRPFDKFAEEIPRSNIGEVPEVAAAREAHLKAHAQVQATLPRLHDSTTAAYIPRAHPIPQPQHYQNNYNPNRDTPEVAAARLEHARAIAALAHQG